MANEISFWERDAKDFIKDYSTAAAKDTASYPPIAIPTRIVNINLTDGKMLCFSFTAWVNTKYVIRHICTNTTAVTGVVIISKMYPDVTTKDWGYITSYEPSFANTVTIQLDTTETIYFIAKVPSKYSELLTFGWQGYIEVYEEKPTPPSLEEQQKQQLQETSTDISKDLLKFKEDIIDRINSLANDILFSIKSIESTISYVFNSIVDSINNLLNKIRSFITDTIFSIVAELQKAFTAVITAVLDTLTSVVQGIKSTIENVVNTVIDYINNLIDEINRLLIEPLLALISNIVNEIRSLPERIADALASIIFEEVEVSE